MTPLDRIKKVHVDIMRHPKWCAFSGVIAMGETKVDDKCPTAYTNGRDKTYGTAFVSSLKDTELRLVVLHETLHVAYRHLHSWKALFKDNAKLANVAADHFVNLSLVDSDAGDGWLTMPDVGIQPEPRYRGWSVQMIFDDLKSQASTSSGSGAGGGGGDDPDSPDSGGGFDEHDWKAAQEMTEAEAQELAAEVDRALRQGEMVARQRGKGTGGGSLAIRDLLAARVDWRQVLRDFVQDTVRGNDESTWARPSRRFLASDLYMPSSETTQVGELVVVFDTSGSCFSGTVITRFASELASVVERVRPSKVRVLYVDTAVHAEQVFDDGQFALAALKPKGGGGTDMPAAFRYVTEKRYTPQAMLIFSDGETPYGTPPAYPVLWCLTEKTPAPWGRTVHVTV